jgi:hypothetical protein
MIKIIDNKKVDITEEEYELYLNICKSYDRPNFNGKDLFIDLFESDNDGILTMIKPPANRGCTIEVFLFVVALYSTQHIRAMENKVNNLCNRLEEKFNE